MLKLTHLFRGECPDWISISSPPKCRPRGTTELFGIGVVFSWGENQRISRQKKKNQTIWTKNSYLYQCWSFNCFNLDHLFGDSKQTKSRSSPSSSSASRWRSSECRSWRSRWVELQQVSLVLKELLPCSLVAAVRQAVPWTRQKRQENAMKNSKNVGKGYEKHGKTMEQNKARTFCSLHKTEATLLNTCRLQFDVELSALHVGLVQSSTDAELAVVLVEDVTDGPNGISLNFILSGQNQIDVKNVHDLLL